MSDARRYAVWPDSRSRSRSRSRALQSWKSCHFQKLSPPLFTVGAGNWPRILKLGHNTWIWSGQIFDICPSFCVTWLWSWPQCQLWRIVCQSRTALIYEFRRPQLYLWNGWSKNIQILCAGRIYQVLWIRDYSLMGVISDIWPFLNFAPNLSYVMLCHTFKFVVLIDTQVS